jgi:hypothetical protein
MLTKPLVINRLSTDLLADWSESGGIVNNSSLGLWITGNRLGDFGFWGEKKNEYARWCLFGVLAFALSGYSAKPSSLIGGLAFPY